MLSWNKNRIESFKLKPECLLTLFRLGLFEGWKRYEFYLKLLSENLKRIFGNSENLEFRQFLLNILQWFEKLKNLRRLQIMTPSNNENELSSQIIIWVLMCRASSFCKSEPQQ